jgi:hypothetical protein
MSEKEIKRGYVKWEDENGFHKELLTDHPELLAKATPIQQLAAEEAKRSEAAAVESAKEDEKDAEATVEDTLEALRSAPPEVITATQLAEEVPESGSEETDESEEHARALQELRKRTV